MVQGAGVLEITRFAYAVIISEKASVFLAQDPSFISRPCIEFSFDALTVGVQSRRSCPGMQHFSRDIIQSFLQNLKVQTVAGQLVNFTIQTSEQSVIVHLLEVGTSQASSTE
jgi:hypothetical protein